MRKIYGSVESTDYQQQQKRVKSTTTRKITWKREKKKIALKERKNNLYAQSYKYSSNNNNNNNNFIRTIPTKILPVLSPKECQIYILATTVQKLEEKFRNMTDWLLLLKHHTKEHK